MQVRVLQVLEFILECYKEVDWLQNGSIGGVAGNGLKLRNLADG